ncbi:MAG: molybdopterin oxidoreductase family protein [Anaerolineales bacterium]
MSNSMQDIYKNSEAIFVIGSNTTEQHPVFGTMIRRAVKNRGAKLIVADPRKIDLAEYATLHLQQKPGTDIALLNGLMNIILTNGWQDDQFIESMTEDFESFKEVVQSYTPEITSAITGIPVNKIIQAAEILGTIKPMAVIWAMGITQHIVGVRNVMSLANLQMLTGNMGIPGGGVNPLRGQNNVQGACDMGGLPNVYPAYQAVTSDQASQKFESAWGTPMDTKVGLTSTEMVPGILEDKIHGLYILGEDPVMSDPDSNHVRKCLEQVDFLVLQELFPSETSNYADVLLPGVSFAEKEGTFTNTERRIQKLNQVIKPLGDAKPDWKIISELAIRLLENKQISKDAPYAGWDYSTPEEIMNEINALAPSYAGISYDRLRNGEELQWPCTGKDHPGTPILHVGKFARGVGKFFPIDHIPPAELPDDDYPIVMSTGRVLYHWHGGQMTRRSEGIMEIYGSALIEVNPEDAIGLGLNGRKTVRVTSRRGSIQADALVTDRVPPGMIYSNFHFPNASANELTQAVLDPVAKIPEYKVTAVKVEIV